jgi:hypothetical protein
LVIKSGRLKRKRETLTKRTLFVFIDESGNFDFKETGTDHLVMSAIFTRKPVRSANYLLKLRYKKLSRGFNIPNFHASEDRQLVRDAVFKALKRSREIGAISLWLDKRKFATKQMNPLDFYKFFGSHFASELANLALSLRIKNLVIVFDKVLSFRDERLVRNELKPLFADVGLESHLYFHNVNRDFNAQIADYVAWANYVHLERAESRPIKSLNKKLTKAIEISTSL